MIFRQLFDSETSTYSYLIADTATREAALVDSVIEKVARDYELLNELGLTLRYCLETHVHADHITGAGRLQELTGCAVIVPEKAPNPYAERQLQHGETLQIGAIPVQAIATPGHTGCDMCYLVNGDRVLTGDALLIRGCGRTDFQSGDPGRLYDSVTRRLFTLPDATLIYPGHDYTGRTVSSIGEEKRWNRRLACKTRTEFIDIMNNLNLPNPKKMADSVPANERSGLQAVVEGLRKIDDDITIAGYVSPEELSQAARDGFRSVLNIRSPDEADFLQEEQQIVEGLGLAYLNVPLTITNINNELAGQTLQFIDDCPKPVLVHCGIGLRAGVLVMMHRATRQGLTPQQASAQAESMNLGLHTSPKLKSFFERYVLEKHG
jgi:uncharacterized protein (TIGR01244 family)